MGWETKYIYTCDRCKAVTETPFSEAPTDWGLATHPEKSIPVEVCPTCKQSFDDWCKENRASLERWWEQKP